MTVEAMKQARRAIRTAQNNLAPSRSSAHLYGDGELWESYESAVKGLDQAIAEAEKQEPVECNIQMDECSSQPEQAPRCKTCGKWTSLPCSVTKQREWIGLTPEERSNCRYWACENFETFGRAIESKLKEKNT